MNGSLTPFMGDMPNLCQKRATGREGYHLLLAFGCYWVEFRVLHREQVKVFAQSPSVCEGDPKLHPRIRYGLCFSQSHPRTGPPFQDMAIRVPRNTVKWGGCFRRKRKGPVAPDLKPAHPWTGPSGTCGGRTSRFSSPVRVVLLVACVERRVHEVQQQHGTRGAGFGHHAGLEPLLLPRLAPRHAEKKKKKKRGPLVERMAEVLRPTGKRGKGLGDQKMWHMTRLLLGSIFSLELVGELLCFPTNRQNGWVGFSCGFSHR